MIIDEVKKLADSGNGKALKYVFVDALDVDPTFEYYAESYVYCNAVPGFLEPHQELTPFIDDYNQWNESYWRALKSDLLKNFSDERMSHMREVAQVYLKEKIKRVNEERKRLAREDVGRELPAAATVQKLPAADAIQKLPVADTVRESPAPDTPTVGSRKAEQERMLKEARQKLAQENREAEEKRKSEAHQRELESRQAMRQTINGSEKNQTSKKGFGIAIAAIAAAAAAVTVAVLLLH